MAIGAISGFVSSVGSDYLFKDGKINWYAALDSSIFGALTGAIAGAGANHTRDITKFVNSKNILNRTIANGTTRAIARQTSALNVHATKLWISSGRYMLSNALSTAHTMWTN